MAVHASDSSTWEVEAGASKVQSQHGCVREFEVQLGYMRPCL